ncbi:MAG: VOC family protein, partial [Sphingobacterium sp.]
MENRIKPCIWFNNNAPEALSYYSAIIPNTGIKFNHGLAIEATIAGLDFIIINANAIAQPNPSISFMLVFETKEELKSVWEKLMVEGQILMPLEKYPFSDYYGWIEDQFGISWQLYLGKLADVN